MGEGGLENFYLTLPGGGEEAGGEGEGFGGQLVDGHFWGRVGVAVDGCG